MRAYALRDSVRWEKEKKKEKLSVSYELFFLDHYSVSYKQQVVLSLHISVTIAFMAFPYSLPYD